MVTHCSECFSCILSFGLIRLGRVVAYQTSDGETPPNARLNCDLFKRPRPQVQCVDVGQLSVTVTEHVRLLVYAGKLVLLTRGSRGSSPTLRGKRQEWEETEVFPQ